MEDLLTRRGELLTDCVEVVEEEVVVRGEVLGACSFVSTVPVCRWELELSGEVPTHCRGVWRECREEYETNSSGKMG